VRTLHLWLSRGPSPAVLAASLVTATACGGETTGGGEPSLGHGGSGASSGGRQGVGGTPGTGSSSGGSPTSSGGTGGMGASSTGGTLPSGCAPYSIVSTFQIPLPAAGTPSHEVCNSAGGPVASGDAAALTIRADPADYRLLHGRITISPVLAPLLGGPPLLELVSGPFALSLAQPNPDGADYVFEARLADSVSYGSMTLWGQPSSTLFRITLPVTCAIATGPVRVITEVNLGICWDEPTAAWTWRGPGEACTVCFFMGEGAAPPVPSPAGESRIALGEMFDVSIQCIARVGSVLVLQATSGSAARLSWSVTGGRLLFTEGDIAVWEPHSEGTGVAQVTAESRQGVGLATFRS
jgi:hypothetical protein